MQKLTSKIPDNLWKLTGAILGIDLALVCLYLLILGKLTLRGLSDALCTSALLLGAATLLPLLGDVGRGLRVGVKVAEDQQRTNVNQTLKKEQTRRAKGMRYTFAFALAALIIGLLSILALVL